MEFRSGATCLIVRRMRNRFLQWRIFFKLLPVDNEKLRIVAVKNLSVVVSQLQIAMQIANVS